MTVDDPAAAAQGPAESDDERAARLQALLSVDLAERTDAQRRRAAAPPAGDAAVDRAPPRRPQASTLWALALVALLATGIGLTYAGTRIIRTSTEGQVVSRVDDPAAPGFEAMVQPTPTLAVLHDRAGTLDAITVLTLPDPDQAGGGVLFVPTRTMGDLPVFGLAALEVAYDFGSPPDVQAEMVGDVLGVGIDEVVVVDADRWEGLVAPVAPLVVDNPSDVDVDGDVAFAEGEVELEAGEVADYLEVRGDDESDLARLYRHELVWRAWLDAVAAAGGGGAVPGELESGLGRFVRHLSSGPVDVVTLPVDRATGDDDGGDDDGGEADYVADTAAVEALVARLVPFPRSPRPGVRERVRLLSGTEDVEASRRLAPELPPLGLEVVVVGNAATLDHATTTIAYAAPQHEDAARDIRELLGVGDVVPDPRPSDVVDITVTLGADHE